MLTAVGMPARGRAGPTWGEWLTDVFRFATIGRVAQAPDKTYQDPL
jgi:hypothetical protein